MSCPFRRGLCEAMEGARMTASALAAATRAAGTPVSAPTLRSWMAGTASPSRRATVRAVETIEALLHLAPGTLVAHLHPIGCTTSAPTCHAMAVARLSDLRREWDLPVTDAVEGLLVTSHLDLTDPATGCLRHSIVGTVRRARARRFPAVLDAAVLDSAMPGGAALDGAALGGAALDGAAWRADAATALPHALDVTGARALRTALLPEGLAAVELELPRVRDAGETVFVEISAAAKPVARTATLRAVALARCVAIAAQISPPAEAPHGWVTRRTAVLGAAETEGQRRPSSASTVQHVEIDMAPGIASVTWEARQPAGASA